VGASRRLGAALVVAVTLLGTAQAAQARPPKWSSVRVQKISDGVPWTEPRITTGPDGTLWLVTNGEKASDSPGAGGEENSAPAIVMYSTDRGRTWHKTKADFAGQTVATPDVDITTLPSGRVIASELDDAGINFPSAVSDDRGRTWQQSHGSNQLADQDRQWVASGPVPGTRKRRVYMLFHNLASGNANHNMFVIPSDDGGKTWGVPVPITLPGDDAYNDLQCADSGGPSTIFANQRDGTVYAEFTTRGTPVQGTGDLGGCATPLAGQPLEFNIVAGTRVWFAQSKDGGQTWTKSLPVDYAKTGQIVSMQVAYAGLDSAGNVYIAYPKSPSGKKYPDYSGAGVMYKWAQPTADAANLRWSPERTFEPPNAKKPGHVLVHITVGDPGRIMGAYWEGTARSGKAAPVWHMKSAQTLNGLSAHPKVTHARIFSGGADTGSASELMGACIDAPPIGGIIAGLFCDRSPDVWGVTLDQRCRTHIVWPAVDKRKTSGADAEHIDATSNPGTWVSNQVGGPTLCAKRAARAKRCRDRRAPVTHITRRDRLNRRRIRLHGRSRDRGCTTSNGLKVVSGVARVRVSVALRRGKGHAKRCRYLTKRGRLTRHYRRCRNSIPLRAKGKRHWRFGRKVRLPRGRYRITARGVDRAKNREKRRRYNSFLVRLR
jgi:hypothetical protein